MIPTLEQIRDVMEQVRGRGWAARTELLIYPRSVMAARSISRPETLTPMPSPIRLQRREWIEENGARSYHWVYEGPIDLGQV